MTVAFSFFAVATKFSGATLLPRSMTSKPAPFSMIPTRFFPMSCRSPCTEPITTLPIVGIPSLTNNGLSKSIPAHIAFAARSTSGRKISWALYFLPIMSMPFMSPLSSMIFGDMFFSIACFVNINTFSLSPRCRYSEISFTISIMLHLFIMGLWCGKERFYPLATRVCFTVTTERI